MTIRYGYARVLPCLAADGTFWSHQGQLKPSGYLTYIFDTSRRWRAYIPSRTAMAIGTCISAKVSLQMMSPNHNLGMYITPASRKLSGPRHNNLVLLRRE